MMKRFLMATCAAGFLAQPVAADPLHDLLPSGARISQLASNVYDEEVRKYRGVRGVYGDYGFEIPSLDISLKTVDGVEYIALDLPQFRISGRNDISLALLTDVSVKLRHFPEDDLNSACQLMSVVQSVEVSKIAVDTRALRDQLGDTSGSRLQTSLELDDFQAKSLRVPGIDCWAGLEMSAGTLKADIDTERSFSAMGFDVVANGPLAPSSAGAFPRSDVSVSVDSLQYKTGLQTSPAGVRNSKLTLDFESDTLLPLLQVLTSELPVKGSKGKLVRKMQLTNAVSYLKGAIDFNFDTIRMQTAGVIPQLFTLNFADAALETSMSGLSGTVDVSQGKYHLDGQLVTTSLFDIFIQADASSRRFSKEHMVAAARGKVSNEQVPTPVFFEGADFQYRDTGFDLAFLHMMSTTPREYSLEMGRVLASRQKKSVRPLALEASEAISRFFLMADDGQKLSISIAPQEPVLISKASRFDVSEVLDAITHAEVSFASDAE